MDGLNGSLNGDGRQQDGGQLRQRLGVGDVPEEVWQKVRSKVQDRLDGMGGDDESLRPREMEVLQGIVGQMKDADIAKALNHPKGLKKSTVRTYCRPLYRKLGCRKGGRAGAVSEVLKVVLEMWRSGMPYPAPKEPPPPRPPPPDKPG